MLCQVVRLPQPMNNIYAGEMRNEMGRLYYNSLQRIFDQRSLYDLIYGLPSGHFTSQPQRSKSFSGKNRSSNNDSNLLEKPRNPTVRTYPCVPEGENAVPTITQKVHRLWVLMSPRLMEMSESTMCERVMVVPR